MTITVSGSSIKNFIFFMKLFCKNFLKKFCKIKLNSYICIVIRNK